MPNNPILQRLREEMNHKISGVLYHEVQIRMTYHSNHMEGSRLSEEQTRHIFETNTVGGRETTPPDRVEKELSLLLDRYHAKEKIAMEDIVDFHFHFECIHPFQDGNGRVGRLIAFEECLKKQSCSVSYFGQ